MTTEGRAGAEVAGSEGMQGLATGTHHKMWCTIGFARHVVAGYNLQCRGDPLTRITPTATSFREEKKDSTRDSRAIPPAATHSHDGGKPMAMERHPITGVPLNEILHERISLNFEEAVTVWVLKIAGEKYATIAMRLGTNPARVGEVLRQEKHPGARDLAELLLSKF